uniref:Uncharacterized protein n=2 Tax=Ditylum brightwellii TaxID=49249 RepID=A0A7S1YVD9_9STRA|mmetsp:Transcript_18334/g.27365  ORF Transcript_18334/g.27365 Transcript_18334/m.27365 type:complete len:1018 (+) Transcript_18334:989-4042(+)
MEDQLVCLELQIESEQAEKYASAKKVEILRKKAQITYEAKVLAEAEADNQRAQVQDQAAEIVKLKNQKEIDDRKFATAVSIKNKVEDELEKLKDESASGVTSVNTEQTALMEKQIEKLKKEKKSAEDQLLSLEDQIESEQDSKKQELERLREKAQTLYEAKLVAEKEAGKQRSQADAKLKQQKEITKAIVNAAKKQVITATFAKKAAEDELNKIRSEGSNSDSAMQESLDELERKVKQLESEKKSIEAQVKSIEQKMEEDTALNQKHVDDLRNVIEESEAISANQRSKLKRQTAEINALKRQQEVADNRLAATSYAKKLAEDELNNIRSSSLSDSDDVAHLEMVVNNLKKEKETTEKQLLSLEKKAFADQAESRSRIEQLREKAKASYDAKVLAEQKAIGESIRLRNIIDDLEKEARQLKEESVVSEEDQELRNERQKQVNHLMEEKRSVEAQVESLIEQVDVEQISKNQLQMQLNNKIKELREEIITATTEKAIAEDELGKMKKESSDAHSNLEKQVVHLNLQKEKTENQLQRLQDQLNAEQSLKLELKKEVETAEASKQTLKKQVEVLQKEVVVTLSAKVCAENELEKFKSSSDSGSNLAQERATQLEQQVQNLESEQKASNEQIEYLEKQVEIEKSKKNELNAMLDKMNKTKLLAESDVHKIRSSTVPQGLLPHPEKQTKDLHDVGSDPFKSEVFEQMQRKIEELTAANKLTEEHNRALTEKLENELLFKEKLKAEIERLSTLPSNKTINALKEELIEAKKMKELALTALVIGKGKLKGALVAKKAIEEQLVKIKSESVRQGSSTDSSTHADKFVDQILSLKEELENVKSGKIQAENLVARLQREVHENRLEKDGISKQISDLKEQLITLQKASPGANGLGNAIVDVPKNDRNSEEEEIMRHNPGVWPVPHTSEEDILHALQQENLKLKTMARLNYHRNNTDSALNLGRDNLLECLRRERELRVQAQDMVCNLAIQAKASLEQQKSEILKLQMKLSILSNRSLRSSKYNSFDRV